MKLQKFGFIILAAGIMNVSLFSATDPKELIKLRKDWDNRLLETTKQIAENSPQFELHYFNQIQAKELTDENYQNETISLEVTIPYMKQIRGGENADLVEDTLKELSKIEESKNWGDKIKGFPWSYLDDVDNDSWMHKAVANHIDRYSFSINLLDGNKVVAKKPITYMICYEKKFSGYVMISDNSDYVETRYIDSNHGRGFPYYEKDTMSFTISINDVDLDNLSVKVENIGNDLAILPAEENAIRYLNTSGTGYYKIVGDHFFSPEEFFTFNLTGDIDTKLFLDFSSSYFSHQFFTGRGADRFDTNNLKENEVNNGFFGFWGKDSQPVKFILPGSSVKKSEDFYNYYLNFEQDKINKKLQEVRGPTRQYVKLSLFEFSREIRKINELTIQPAYAALKNDVFKYEIQTSNLTELSNLLQKANFKIDLRLQTESTKDVIKSHAFYKCQSLVSVTILNDIAKIEDCAFTDCPNLVSFSIEAASGANDISEYAFYLCPKLSRISLPAKMKGALKSKTYKDMIKKGVIILN